MSKTKLKCEYCSNLITEKDLKCPNCGANCSKVIEKYKEEKEEEEKAKQEEQRQEAEKMLKGFGKSFSLFALIPIIMFIVVAILIITSFFSFGKDIKSENDNFFDDVEEQVEDKQEQVTVGYQETAKTKNANITLDSYEFYEYKSNEFPEQYNTKDGYQKIAFQVKIENKTDEEVKTVFDYKYSMKADGYKVDEAEYKVGMFTYASPGKENYPTIKNADIGPKETLQGYVNFTVPTNAKELTLRIGDYVTIKMDNPAYKG